MYNGVAVKHVKYGQGTIKSIENGHVIVEFSIGEKSFVFPDAINTFLRTDNEELMRFAETQKVKKAEEIEKKREEQEKERQNSSAKRMLAYNYSGDFETPLLGARALDIDFSSQEEFFEAIGYLAKPGVIAYYQAEVPDNGKDVMFERMFPDQEYRKIYVNEGSNGVTKQGCQFRINMSTKRNCPESLLPHLGTPSGNWVGRINRSKFVLKLVQTYGFKFGYRQDYKAIESRIPEKYMESFLKGYNR